MATEFKLHINEIPRYTKAGHAGEKNLAVMNKGVPFSKRKCLNFLDRKWSEDGENTMPFVIIIKKKPRTLIKISTTVKC